MLLVFFILFGVVMCWSLSVTIVVVAAAAAAVVVVVVIPPRLRRLLQHVAVDGSI